MMRKNITIMLVIFVDLFIIYIFPYSAQEPSYMTGRYLLLTREYASAKTQAVIPEPHENTTFISSFNDSSLKCVEISALFLKV